MMCRIPWKRRIIILRFALAALLGMVGLILGASRLSPLVSAGTSETVASTSREVLELEWEMLLPEEERFSFEFALPTHDYLDEEGPAMKQSGSFQTNPKLNGVTVKIPGFIVPLSITRGGVVSEFFLVPYFGACIHIPPPPPNQIIYVKMSEGFRLDSIYEPKWITGILQTGVKNTKMASAAYTLSGEQIEAYEY